MIVFLTVVPAGKEAMSEDVARVIEIIDRSGLEYRLTAMGTVIEGEPDAVWALVRRCHEEMRKTNRRVSTHLVIDDRESAVDSIHGKVDRVERRLRRKLKT
jgi:uncharacterized protein (TIGR00106 family)